MPVLNFKYLQELKAFLPMQEFLLEIQNLIDAFKEANPAHIGKGDTPQPTQKKRSPQWRFNNTLLEYIMYTTHLQKLIQTHLDNLEVEEEREQVSQQWELLKQNIILQTHTIATYLHRQKQKQHQEILKAITIAK